MPVSDKRLAAIPTPANSPATENVVIAATFTAEPLEESLTYWFRKLGIEARPQFAPFNRVFQQLLDPGSLLSANKRGMNCVLLRVEDLESSAALEDDVSSLVTAIRTASRRAEVPLLVMTCATNGASARLATVEGHLRAELAGDATIQIVTAEEIAALYPVAEPFDERSAELGAIPYTQEYFTALGTTIARRFSAGLRAPYKVIVLDCDNTLWTGVCGEDGAAGITLGPGSLELQRFMRAEAEAGMLLCLASKNSETDVQAVFSSRPDMILQPGHIVGWRVNWLPKSENIRSLAQELNLGLDSFVFIDDNPVECAEVRANCPEVLVLERPADEQIPRFLAHQWAFDRYRITAEDRQRTKLYIEGRDRNRLQAVSATYADFLAGLNLKIDIADLSFDQLPRVAQLTQRTNQFNFTTRRRTEGEIRALLDDGRARILTVRVSDRFGDYGLVGVAVCIERSACLEIDTFLLSCRVLGKGVEHRLLAHIGQLAVDRGIGVVKAVVIPTARNEPARGFIEAVAGAFRSEGADDTAYAIPAVFAAGIGFHAEASAVPTAVGDPKPEIATPSAVPVPRDFFEWIEANACDAARILRLIDAAASVRVAPAITRVAPESELEQQIAQIWKKLLRVEQVGVTDNYFDLGGDSFNAVRLFVQIEKLTGRRLPLTTLLQAPTIRELATVIEREGYESPWECLVAIKPGGSRPPLYCAHGVGGNVVSYVDLARYLDHDQPLYGIQAVGLSGKRCRRNLSVEEMSAIYLEEIRTFQRRGPYYLAGTSFGGLVAYEIARQLTAAGEEVAFIGLFDTYGPGYPKLIPTTTRWQRRWYRLRSRVGLHWGNLMATPPAERPAYIGAKLKRMGLTAKRLTRGKFLNLRSSVKLRVERMFWPEAIREADKAGHWAAGDYVPQPFGASITIFRAIDQPPGIVPDATLGWGPIAGKIDIYDTPGHHGAIVLEPRARVLAPQLAHALAKARGRYVDANQPAYLNS